MASWYLWFRLFFQSRKPAVPLPSCQREKKNRRAPPGGKQHRVGFPRVLLPWVLQMSCNPSDLPFQMPSTRGAGSHIWQSRAGASLAGAALAASVALLRPGWGAGLACKLQKPRGLASQTREP